VVKDPDQVLQFSSALPLQLLSMLSAQTSGSPGLMAAFVSLQSPAVVM